MSTGFGFSFEMFYSAGIQVSSLLDRATIHASTWEKLSVVPFVEQRKSSSDPRGTVAKARERNSASKLKAWKGNEYERVGRLTEDHNQIYHTNDPHK